MKRRRGGSLKRSGCSWTIKASHVAKLAYAAHGQSGCFEGARAVGRAHQKAQPEMTLDLRARLGRKPGDVGADPANAAEERFPVVRERLKVHSDRKRSLHNVFEADLRP